MDLMLKGHVALVQGASKGIGRGIAEALATEGCDLMLTARTEDTLLRTAREIADSTGRRVLYNVADSAYFEPQEKVLQRIEDEFGRLDIIVCNSGGPPSGTIQTLSVTQWRQAADLLIVAPVYLAKVALPLLKRSPAPRVFVITSSSTREPIDGLTLSNVFRPGVVGMIKTMATELAEEKVCCHAISPGRINTERLVNVLCMQASRSGRSPEEVRDDLLQKIPAGRLGRPDDIGHLIAYLSSPIADYLTGMNWMVDGGLVKSI